MLIPLTGGAPRSAALWAVTGVIVTRALALASGVIVARLSGVEDFGEFSLVLSTTALLTTLGGAGFSAALARETARVSAVAPDALARFHRLGLLAALAAGLACALLLVAGGYGLAAIVGWDAEVLGNLRWAGVLVITGLVSTAHIAHLQGAERFRDAALFGASRGATAALLTGAGAMVAGVPGALAGMGIGEASILAVVAWPVQRAVAAGKRVELPPVAWRSMLGATYAGSLATTGAQWGLRAALVSGPDGWRQVALFDAAARFGTLVPFLAAALAPVHVPAMTRRFLGEDAVGWHDGLDRLTRMTAVQVVLGAGALVLLGDALLRLFGPSFAAGRAALTVWAVAGAAAAFNVVWGQVLVAGGKVRLRGSLDVILGGAALVLALPLARRGGATGAALAWMLPMTGVAVVLGMLAYGSGPRGRGQPK